MKRKINKTGILLGSITAAAVFCGAVFPQIMSGYQWHKMKETVRIFDTQEVKIAYSDQVTDSLKLVQNCEKLTQLSEQQIQAVYSEKQIGERAGQFFRQIGKLTGGKSEQVKDLKEVAASPYLAVATTSEKSQASSSILWKWSCYSKKDDLNVTMWIDDSSGKVVSFYGYGLGVSLSGAEYGINSFLTDYYKLTDGNVYYDGGELCFSYQTEDADSPLEITLRYDGYYLDFNPFPEQGTSDTSTFLIEK